MAIDKNSLEIYVTERDDDLVDLLVFCRKEKVYDLWERSNLLVLDDEVYDRYWSNAVPLDGGVFARILEYVKANFQPIDLLSEEDEPTSDPYPDGTPKEVVWKALRCELPEEELKKLRYERAEQDDYYDFDLIMQGFHRYKNGEISSDYYRHWCMAWSCLDDVTNQPSTVLKWYRKVAECFQDESRENLICDAEAKRWGEMKRLMAELKWYNFCIAKAKHKRETPFENDGFVIYSLQTLHGDFYEGSRSEEKYVFLIADTKGKKFNLIDVELPVFDEGINYIYCTDEQEFARATKKYRNFTFDMACGLKYIPKSEK
jgi:hypothetical protein